MRNVSLVAVKASSGSDKSDDSVQKTTTATDEEWPRVTTVPVENQELLKLERVEAETKNQRNARGESLQHPGKWTQEMVAQWWCRTLQRLAVKSKWVQKREEAQVPPPPKISGKTLIRWPQARLEQACGARSGAQRRALADSSKAGQMAKCLFSRLRFLMQESGKRKQQMARARSKAVLRPADAAADAGGDTTARKSRRPPRQRRPRPSNRQPSSNPNRRLELSSAPATTRVGNALDLVQDDALDRILSAPHQQQRRRQTGLQQTVERGRGKGTNGGRTQRRTGGGSGRNRNYFRSAAQTVLNRSGVKK